MENLIGKKAMTWALKRVVRQNYRAYHKALDAQSCGRELAEEMNLGNCMRFKKIANEALDKLAIIDPENCPKTRL